MRWFCVFLLLLTTSSGADTLRLEFAQEGDPEKPRALIVIHNTFENRDALKPFFQQWADRSWGRDQYCSVYSYEYDNNGLYDLPTPEELGARLFSKIRSGSFKSGKPDDVNPSRRVSPTDHRQPEPEMKGENFELLLAGHGYGGLVARETARLANTSGIKVTRVAYIGTPLDGLSTVELILNLTVREKAVNLGLDQPLAPESLFRLSPGWWHLTELFNPNRDWPTYFAPAMTDVLAMAAYGENAPLSHPTDNVLYGRGRMVGVNRKETDGFVNQTSAWGQSTGPMPWLEETELAADHRTLTLSSSQFLLKKLVDQNMVFSYLTQRQVIEEKVRGEGEDALEPLGVYWDERDLNGMIPQWRPKYASQKGLYEQMWGVAP